MRDRHSMPRAVALVAGLALAAGACSSGETATTAAGAPATSGSVAPTTAPPATAPGTTAASSTTTTEPPTTAPPTTPVPTTAAVGPTDAVVRAAATTAATGRGAYTLTVANASGTPIVTATGAYLSAQNQAAATLDMTGLAGVVAASGGTGSVMASFLRDPVEAVTVGDASYLRWSVIAQLAGASTAWIQFSAPAGSASVGLPTTDASGLLDGMVGATGAAPKGTEAIAGAPATRYAVTVDTQKALAAMAPARRPTFQKLMQLVGNAPTVTFDAWVGADGNLKRIQTVIPTNTLITAIGGATVANLINEKQLGPTMTFSVDYTGPGQQVQITVPSPAEVTTVDPAKLASLLGPAPK